MVSLSSHGSQTDITAIEGGSKVGPAVVCLEFERLTLDHQLKKENHIEFGQVRLRPRTGQTHPTADKTISFCVVLAATIGIHHQ